MARPIDEKIVAMKMDNSDFKKKAAETTGLFGKLTQSLKKIPGVNLGKTTSELHNIQKATDGIKMDRLAGAVDKVAGRFSNLGVVGTTALATIANKATNVALNLGKTLGLDQITSGFQEYETKMGAINTMLFNTKWEGNTLEDVNKYLRELNEYADKTIYNFAEMTRSIGRFTTAGIGLEDSTIAIKGLGNLAALSGATGEAYNRALYQISQGLQGDYFQAIDWNSIEEAGMGGKYTKDALMETAESMGIAIDKSETFRNSLKDGWLTSEVFIETMRKFGEDESMVEAATKVRTFTQFMDNLKESIGSGWAQSWEIIFGDFEEATKLWTGLSDFFGGFFEKQTKARNKFLSAIFEGGGMGNVLDGLQNAAEPIVQLFSSLGKGFRNAFPPASTDGIKKTVLAFKDLTANFKFSERTVANLETIFSGFFSIFAVGWKVFKAGAIAIGEILKVFGKLGAMVIELIAKVAMIPIEFNNSISSTKIFEAALDGLITVLKVIASVLEYAVSGLLVFAGAMAEVYGILVKNDFTGIGPWSEDSLVVDKLFRIREALESFGGAIKSAWNVLSKSDFSSGLFSKDSGTAQFLSKVGDAFRSLGSSIMSLEFSLEPISRGFSVLMDNIGQFYNWIKDVFTGIGSFIVENFPSGRDILAGGFIAGLATVTGIAVKLAYDFMQIFKGWGEIGPGITDTLESIGGAFNNFSMQIRAQALMTIAIAIGILAASFWAIAKLDPDQNTRVMYSLIGSLMALVGAMAIMTKYDITGTGMRAAAQIVALSIAFGILSLALRNISNLSWNEITKGIFGLVGTIGVFSGAMVIISKFGGPKMAGSAMQMVALAGTVFILVSAIREIAEQPWGVLAKGMTGLAIVLGIFGTAIATMSKVGGKVAASSLQFVAIAGSVLLLVHAMKQISEIDTANLLTGLATIGAILAAIAAFSLAVKNASIMSAGVGITLLAVALNLLIVPILALGSMNLGTLAKGLGAMAIALTAIGLASKLMTGMVAAGAGLVLLAVGMNMLLVPITAFAAMPLKALAIGIGALAVGILAVGGAAILLGGAAPALLLGAAGIAAVGIAMLAAGAGIALFSTGLVTLATMTAASVTTIVATLGTLIVGLASLIPKAVEFVGQLIVAMITTIAEKTPVIAGKMIDMATAMLAAISERIPEFAAAATDLIVGFMGAMEAQIPRIMTSMTTLMLALAEAIRTNGPQFIAAWLSIMSEVVILMVQTGVAVINALFGWIPGVTDATAKIGSTAEATIRAHFDAVGAGLDKGNDFSSSLRSTRGGAQDAGAEVGTAAEGGADTADLYSIGGSHGIDFASAIDSTAFDARGAGQNIAISGREGADGISMTGVGNNFGFGFANGINTPSVLERVTNAGLAIAKAARYAVTGWLDMHSPSRLLEKDGGFFSEGFAKGIKGKADMVADNAKGVAMTARDTLNKFIDNFQLPEDDNELHFKAVVDYEEVDVNKFGKIAPLSIQPDTSLTTSLARSARFERYPTQPQIVKSEPEDKGPKADKRPYVIQVVTPDGRDVARWLVDDISEFQKFKIATSDQF